MTLGVKVMMMDMEAGEDTEEVDTVDTEVTEVVDTEENMELKEATTNML